VICILFWQLILNAIIVLNNLNDITIIIHIFVWWYDIILLLSGKWSIEIRNEMFNVYNIISQEKIEQSVEKGEGIVPSTFIWLPVPGSVLETFAYLFQ